MCGSAAGSRWQWGVSCREDVAGRCRVLAVQLLQGKASVRQAESCVRSSQADTHSGMSRDMPATTPTRRRSLACVPLLQHMHGHAGRCQTHLCLLPGAAALGSWRAGPQR